MEAEINRPITRNELITLDKLKLKWKELSVEDIILDGLYSKSIRIVKEYFDKYLKIDLKEKKITDIGLKSVVQLLADKDLVGAEFLLNQMNFDVNQKIYQICFFTPYKQLRDYLIQVLIDRKKLNEKEVELINYIKKLEIAYPCRSFEQAKTFLKPYIKELSDETGDIKSRDENFHTKEIVQYGDTEQPDSAFNAGRYSHAVIEWIREWSPEIRDQVLAASLISNPNLAQTEINKIDSKTIWTVLIEQNNVNKMIDWIDYSFSSEKKEEYYLFKTNVNQEMIDMLYTNRYLPSDSQEILLDHLASHNQFCSQERDDFHKFLNRLSSSSTLLNKNVFQSLPDSFHLEFIKMLFKNGDPPYYFIWSYLDHYSKIHNKSMHGLLTDSSLIDLHESNNFKMMLAFRQKINIPSIEPNKFFLNLCIKNFEYCLNLKEPLQVSNLFSSKYKKHHLAALGLSLYQDIPISQTEAAQLDHLLDEYPALRWLTDSKPNVQPVSLYTLLHEHTELDLTKCFGWQKGNSFNLYKNDESMSKLYSSLPSFENKEFVKKYAYKDRLDYSYFISKGRPFYAYYHLMDSQQKKYGKPHKTIMEEARLRAYLIMIEDFLNEQIVLSCIFFTEMMEADTFKLKLTLNLMRTLYEHYKKHGMDENEASQNCINLFVEFFKEEIEAKKIVSLFEDILVTQMLENYDLKNMFSIDAANIWVPIMCFCKFYNLPYTNKYLELCAESNQWLMFLIFAQMYQFPRHQVIACLDYFTDIGLKQHLEYALHNVINGVNLNELSNSTEQTNVQTSTTTTSSKFKDVIKKTENKLSSMINSSSWFKSKKSKNSSKKENESENKSSKNKHSDSSDSDSDNFEIESKPSEETQETLESIDFYELLITCEKSPDPILALQLEALKWYTPVLAVFATFYQNYDKISCLCTFLYASMKIYIPPSKDQNQKEANNQNKKIDTNKSSLFNLNDLKYAIQLAASKSYLRTLLNSLRIFLPATVLDIYVEFLYNVYVTKEIGQAKKLYSIYKNELIKLSLNKHNSNVPIEWYDDVITKITRITILKSETIEDLENLSKIVEKDNQFRRLIKVVHILKSNKIVIDYHDWLDINDQSERFIQICFEIIEELLKIQKFDEAEDLANFCEMSKDRIHLARIGRQIELLRLNNDFEEILEFWKNAHIELMKIGIKDSDFIDFLKFQNSLSNLMLEKIVLLNFICQLCPNDNETSKSLMVLLFHFTVETKKKNELNNIKEIFKKMLLFGVLKKDPIKELVENIIKEGHVNDFSEKNPNLNEQDKEALNILLYNLVDIGKLTQAYVIAKYFKYFNQDFRILLNMIYICLDMIKPEDLDYKDEAIDTSSFKSIKLTNVLRSLSRPAELSESSVMDKLNFLNKLVGLCYYGNKFSKRIKLDFLLANEVFKISYTKLLNENEWNLLKMLLYSTYSNRYELAKDFVKLYDLNLEILADYILNEFISCLKLTVKNVQIMPKNQTQSLTMTLDPSNNDDFSKLTRIFDQNLNVFGYKLLDKSRNILDDAKQTQDFMILTELLIRSHDCFTQTCSMDAISNVLQTCKSCANKLEKAGEFNIMIRLLTGIGRFSEMTYIMDFLWKNHQFEMLFGKGIGKNDFLRLALLDYLKRYHPNDNETYTMVTLNFTMHREIAKMLEDAAYQQLKLLENKKLENTSETLTYLQSILQYFGDAAQSYMKEDCVKQVESCIKKAKLVALQIHFLSSNLVVLNLNQASVQKFLISHPKFWESYLVSDAYDRKSDLPMALFHQFVLNNNEKYMLDYKAHLQISYNVIEEITNRYKLWIDSNNVNEQSIQNMKRLLKFCKDLGIYYKLITVLDFQDLISEIQTSEYASIISDMISTKKL